MGDRPGSSSRVRTSEDKVRRKDLCWSVRAIYILQKLSDVSGPSLGEAGRYSEDLHPEVAVRLAEVLSRIEPFCHEWFIDAYKVMVPLFFTPAP